MRLLTVETPRDFNLFLTSCTHFGSRLCHEDGIEQMIDMIKHPYEGVDNNHAIHHGDIIEGIKIDDPRFVRAASLQPEILPQVDYAIEKLYPIRHNLKVINHGNHELKLHKFGNIAAHIAKNLGVPYGTNSCKISYRDEDTGELLFKHYASHGRKSIGSSADDPIRQRANMQLQLKRHLKMKAGDCMLMSKGHTHRVITLEPNPELFLYDDGNKVGHGHVRSKQNAKYIPAEMRYYANVGAFYKLYGNEMHSYDSKDIMNSVFSSYAEEAEYDPIELGFVVAVVRDGKVRGLREIYVN